MGSSTPQLPSIFALEQNRCPFQPICKRRFCSQMHVEGQHQPAKPGECWKAVCRDASCRLVHPGRPTAQAAPVGSTAAVNRMTPHASRTPQIKLNQQIKSYQCKINHDGGVCDGKCAKAHGNHPSAAMRCQLLPGFCKYFFLRNGCKFSHTAK